MVHHNEVPRAISHCKGILKDKIYELWNGRWTREKTCRQTRIFYPQPDPNHSKILLKFARSQLSTYIKVVTGHNNLAYNASKIDPTIDPVCSLCEEADQTFQHFVTECPRLRQTRQDIGIREEDRDSWTPEHLLELARVPAVEVLFNRV